MDELQQIDSLNNIVQLLRETIINNNKDASNFVRYIQLYVCAFGALFLGIIWYHIISQKDSNKKDLGLLYIAVALVVWVISIYYRIDTNQCSDTYLRILSTINNGFFFASLPYFKFGFERIKSKFNFFNDKNHWGTLVLIACLVFIALIPALCNSLLIHRFDFFLSAIALSAIGYGTIYSFYKRGYGIPFIITGILFSSFLVFSQVFNILDYNVAAPCDHKFSASRLIAVVAQIAFVNLLLVLAQTWAVEESVKSKEKEIEELKQKVDDLNRLVIPTEVAQQDEVKSFETIININNDPQQLPTQILGSSLKIGLADGIYFFNLTLPEKNIYDFSFTDKNPVNLFKFLLFYAYGKIEGKTNIEQKSDNYATTEFNNVIIQSLNKKLREKGFSPIEKSDLLRNNIVNWELTINDIEIISIQELLDTEDIHLILTPLL